MPIPSSPYNASLSHYYSINPFYFLMPGRAIFVCVLYYLVIDDEILAIYGLNGLFAFVYRYRDDLLIPDTYPRLNEGPVGIIVLYMFICVLFIAIIGYISHF
jgi:hypothetical protein